LFLYIKEFSQILIFIPVNDLMHTIFKKHIKFFRSKTRNRLSTKQNFCPTVELLYQSEYRRDVRSTNERKSYNISIRIYLLSRKVQISKCNLRILMCFILYIENPRSCREQCIRFVYKSLSI